MKLKVCIANPRGQIRNLEAHSTNLRFGRAVIQFTPGYRTGYAPFEHCVLEIRSGYSMTYIEVVAGFASLEDDTLTVVADRFDEIPSIGETVAAQCGLNGSAHRAGTPSDDHCAVCRRPMKGDSGFCQLTVDGRFLMLRCPLCIQAFQKNPSAYLRSRLAHTENGGNDHASVDSF
jgi:hypothetical protein